MARDHKIDKAVSYISKHKSFSVTKDSDPDLLEAIEYAETLGFLRIDHSTRYRMYRMAEKGQRLADADYNHSSIGAQDSSIVINSGNTHIGDNHGTIVQNSKNGASESYLQKNLWQIIGILVAITIAIVSWTYFS